MRRPSDAADPAGLPGTAGPSQEAAAHQPANARALEVAALRLLARREHSVEELKRKLLASGHSEALIEPLIAKLTAKRLVSDDRYVGSFVHHHARRGQGPVRIRAELRRQGIADGRIEQAFEREGCDWLRLACEVRQRKFGAALPGTRPERAKQARFLQYRGFDADQIRAALQDDPHASYEPDLGETDGGADEPDG